MLNTGYVYRWAIRYVSPTFLPNPSAPSDVKRFIAKDTKKLCLSPAWLHAPRFKPVVVNDVYNSNGTLW